MNDQTRTPILPLERWNAAKAEAERISPSPKTSTAIAGFGGLFGGYFAAYMLLSVSELLGLAGLDADDPTFGGPAVLAAIASGAIGFLFIRAKEKAHSAAFDRVLETYESRWREENSRLK